MLCISASLINLCLSECVTLSLFLLSSFLREIGWLRELFPRYFTTAIWLRPSPYVICLDLSVTCFCTHTYSKHRKTWCTLRSRSSHRLVIVLTQLFHLWLKSTSWVDSYHRFTPTSQTPGNLFRSHKGGMM